MKVRWKKKMATKKTKTVTNSKYYVSWGRTDVTYTRCFNKEEQRTYFIQNYIGESVKVKTWESEE